MTGKQLKICGMRYIKYELECDGRSTIALTNGFIVADLRRPLVATAALVDRGFRVVLDRESYLGKANTRETARQCSVPAIENA